MKAQDSLATATETDRACDPLAAAGSLRFSVVIPIYNRSEELRRLLGALANQSFPHDRFEVLVCDDGSTEDLSAVVDEAAARPGPAIARWRQENAGPGAARNLGLEHARGEIMASLDSDCLPEPDWLEALDRAFADPAAGLVGGPIGFAGARHLSGRCVGFLMASALGGGGATEPRGRFRLEFFPCTGNLAVRRELAIAVGGFPSQFRNEDTEFSHALGQMGVAPRFVADARVLHDERSSLATVFRESVQKGACRIRSVRGRDLRQWLPALPAALVAYLAALAAVAALEPAYLGVAALPLAGYALVLVTLAVQGGLALGDPLAACAIPVYAVLLHLGYGIGYLASRLRLGDGTGNPASRRGRLGGEVRPG